MQTDETLYEMDQRMDTMSGRIHEAMDRCRNRMEEACTNLSDRSREIAHKTDSYVREHSWESVCTAAGVGFLIGLFLNRR